MKCCTQKNGEINYIAGCIKTKQKEHFSLISLVRSCISCAIPSKIPRKLRQSFPFLYLKNKKNKAVNLNMISSFPPLLHDINVEYLCYSLNHKFMRCISECYILLPYPVFFFLQCLCQKNKQQETKRTTLRMPNVVPHHCTNRVLKLLTFLSRWEALLSLWYGCSCKQSYIFVS